MTKLNIRRIIFFDIDGTLHKQNIFSCFLFYLILRLPLNIILVVPLLPVVAIGMLICGQLSRWPISLLLWSITFGHKEERLQYIQSHFITFFRRRLQQFPQVLARLNNYLTSHDTQVWLITGSPESLVKQIYCNTKFLSQVKLIGSRINRCYGGWVLTLRCLGHEKVTQLEYKLGIPLKLYSGYSNSAHDDPLLYFCQYRWRVMQNGKLRQLK